MNVARRRYVLRVIGVTGVDSAPTVRVVISGHDDQPFDLPVSLIREYIPNYKSTMGDRLAATLPLSEDVDPLSLSDFQLLMKGYAAESLLRFPVRLQFNDELQRLCNNIAKVRDVDPNLAKELVDDLQTLVMQLI